MASFRFRTPYKAIDWAAVKRIDLQRVVHVTDIDALESILDLLSYGDVGASEEDPVQLKEAFRAAQLAIQYLLYVQNKLSAQTCHLKTALAAEHDRYEREKNIILDQNKDTSDSLRELLQLKRENARLKEQLSAAQALVPAKKCNEPAEVKIVEKQVQVPVNDPHVLERLQTLEAEIKHLAESRKNAQREVTKLRESMIKLVAQAEATKLHPSLDQPEAAPPSRVVTVAQPRQRQRTTSNEEVKDRREIINGISHEQEMPLLQTELAKVLKHSRQVERQKDDLQRQLVKLLSEREAAEKQAHQSQSATNAAIPEVSYQPDSSNAVGAPSQTAASFHPNTVQPPPPQSNDQKGEDIPNQTPLHDRSNTVDSRPTSSQKLQFKREMPCKLPGQPTVVSRFPHSVPEMQGVRRELDSELRSEVAAGLYSLGIDPNRQELDDEETARCLADLRKRREDALQMMSDIDRARAQYMRSTVGWHLNRVSSPAQSPSIHKTNPYTLPQKNLHPLKTKPPPLNNNAPTNNNSGLVVSNTINANGITLVDKAIHDSHDEEFYSPLRLGSPKHAALASSPLSGSSSASGTPTVNELIQRYNQPPQRPHQQQAPNPWTTIHERVLRGNTPAAPFTTGMMHTMQLPNLTPDERDLYNQYS